MAEFESDIVDDSIITVKRVSSFKDDSHVTAIAAVSGEQAWIILDQVDLGYQVHDTDAHTPMKLVDKSGEVLVSVLICGKVRAAAADKAANCYIALDKQVLKVTPSGTIGSLFGIKQGRIYALACNESCGAVLDLVISEDNGTKIYDYQVTGLILREAKLNFEDRYLHNYCTLQGGLLFWRYSSGGQYFMNVFDRNGNVTHSTNFGERKALFLQEIPYNKNGTAIVDVKNNKFLERVMKEKSNSNKTPAEVLLQQVVEVCVSTGQMPCSKGDDNCIWIRDKGAITVFEFE